MEKNGLNNEICNRNRNRHRGTNNRNGGKQQTDGFSLNSDSSALSDLWDDDSSTIYSSTDSIDDSDCIVDLKITRPTITSSKKHNKQKLSHRSVANSVANALTAVTKCTKPDSRSNVITSDHKKDKNNLAMFSEDEYDNDNDSAFYSGRRTATKTNSSSSSASFTQQQEKKSKNSNTGTNNADGNSGSSCGIINSFVKLRIGSNNKNSKSTKNETKGCGGTDSADSGIRERDDPDYHIIDDPSLASTSSSINKQPRTSAEFEEIFLKKNSIGNEENGDWSKSKSNNDGNTARASTLPSTITSLLHIPNKNRSDTSVLDPSTNKNSSCGHSTKSLLSSVHFSTITHLTSLAKNIRFASMAPLGKSHHLSCGNSSNTHSKSKFDPILCKYCNIFYWIVIIDLI